MSYVIQAVLSNPRRPECGQITIPFPIPVDQYDQTIEMLQRADLGFSVNRDCTVDEVNSRYNVLNTLVGTLINIDQLDYLAKRLDGFCSGEVSQFEAMAHKLELADIKDFINLTYCCQQATVITDFSDLGAVGRSHFLSMNGGCARMEELENLNGEEAAHLLINGGGGVITPYGVVYDNGMVLDHQYNGHQFPAYDYEKSLAALEITPKRGLAEGKNPEYLYLPAAEHQIERTLLRVGITALYDAQVRLDFDELPEKVAEALDLEHLSGDDLPALNRMCQAITPLKDADIEKLNAVVLMTEASGFASVCCLAENLDQFDFTPGVQTPEEYGKYMIQKSGHFEYDEELPVFYRFPAGILRIFRRNTMPREKIKFALRISPETQQLVKEMCPRDNCHTQNEFIERAIRFYAGYVSGQEATAYLPPALASVLRGTVQDTENRICRLLFKLAVELDMVMNVLAAGMEISDDALRSLRGRCVQNVKKTSGSVTLDKAVEYQRGGV